MAPPPRGEVRGPREPTPEFRKWVASLEHAQRKRQNPVGRTPVAARNSGGWLHRLQVPGVGLKVVRAVAWTFALVMVAAGAISVVNHLQNKEQLIRLDIRKS